MENYSKISDAEWDVMKIIWKYPYCTASEVIKALEDYKDWKPKTVKTLIRRLLEKQVLGYEVSGREYKYFSLVNEQECIKSESNSFLQRIYRGSIKALLLNYIEDNKLSKEDIEELTNILKERK